MARRNPYNNEISTDVEVVKQLMLEFLDRFGDPRYGGTVKFTVNHGGSSMIEVWAGDGAGFKTFPIDAGKVKL